MWASKAYLCWYKSFNTRYHGYVNESTTQQPWEKRKEELFPFIEIPLDRRVSTIVGSNESGKSHLLSATEKVFKGWSTTESGDHELYDIQHICRYCALDSLDANAWPVIGVELRFGNQEEYDTCISTLKATGTAVSQSDRILRVIIDGSQKPEQFAAVYDHQPTRLASLTKDAWLALCTQSLPEVHFINSKLALSNEVHIQQLLDMYAKRNPSQAYEPLALHELASTLLGFDFKHDSPPGQAIVNQLNDVKQQLSQKVLGPKESVKLETLLFDDLLGISADTLHRIKELTAGNRGYVERTIEEINHRLVETLDISQFWQQDDDFSLQVEYKGGFFYFLITDKTGATYTFNERSSGLRYFLSYYVQLKAIKQSMGKRGAIILMDEPDSFLSAQAQRNLLQVFESIVEVAPNSGAAQLIYTTHSPFLINRNFPHRIALLRKGDGSEGTQLVQASATRRYEPVRSGLGIDCAETLFVGTMNVILEGLSDQKVLVASIQKFGNPSKIDELLDLNKVTFVSADGVRNVPRLVEKLTTGSEKRPVVVAFLDGDGPGQVVAQELEGKKLLESEFIGTIADVGLTPSWNQTPKQLEDIVPPKMLAIAICKYLKTEWGEEGINHNEIETQIGDAANGDTMAKRVVTVTKGKAGSEASALTDIEVKGALFQSFVDCLTDTNEFEVNAETKSALAEFESNIRGICGKLQLMLTAAETRSRRDRLLKNVRLAIERFEKSSRKQATKADVDRCLRRIDDECTGNTEPARLARENVIQLRNILDDEVASAGENVVIESWLARLRKLWDTPWRQEKSNWK